MSFFRKLFQKNETEETPADEAPVVLAESSGAESQADQEEPEQRADLPEDPAPDPEPISTDDALAEERVSAPASADEDGPAWWEESSPVAAPGEQVPLTPTDDRPALSEPPDELAGQDDPLRAADVIGQAIAADIGDAEVVIRDPALPAQDLDEDIEEGGTRPLTAADAPMLAALRSNRSLAAAALRDIGRIRSVNQDSIFALLTTIPRETSDVSIGLFIVADGMGGHHGGEIASRLAISTVARYVMAELIVPALADGATEALQPLIIAAIQEANRAIWDHAQSLGSDMGTTCTVALLLGRALYIGHVGDSRAYLVTPTGMKLITSDHSTVGRLIQVGQLDPSEAREHPLRSQLYRTVGQHPEVMVDFIYQPIGDATHLLLSSDGLWGMLDEEVLLDVLEHTVWPQDACRELIARANLAGGEDNISAVVVTLPAQT